MRTTTATAESRLEKMLNDGIRRAGGMSYKMAPTTAGLPDRIVFWPGGRIELVELKTTKGKLRRIQEIVHYRMAKLGTEVLVLHGDSDVRAYLASRQQINQPQAASRPSDRLGGMRSTCPRCGDEFTQDKKPGRPRTYCSPQCHYVADVCPQCGDVFLGYFGQIFCKRECRRSWLNGLDRRPPDYLASKQ